MSYCEGCATRDNHVDALKAQLAERDHRLTCLIMEAEGLRGQIAALGRDPREYPYQTHVACRTRDSWLETLALCLPHELGEDKDRLIKQMVEQIAALTAERDRLRGLLNQVPRMLNESEVLGEYEANEINTGSRKKMRAMIDGFRDSVRDALATQPPAPPQEDQK